VDAIFLNLCGRSLSFYTEEKLVQLLHQWPGWRVRLYPRQVRWWHQTGRCGGYTSRLCCNLVRPRQSGELGTEEPDDVQQAQVQGPAPGEKQPHAPVQAWGLTWLRAPLQRGTWVSWWMTGWPWASSVPWLPRRPMGSWGALRAVWPAGRGRFSFPSTLP